MHERRLCVPSKILLLKGLEGPAFRAFSEKSPCRCSFTVNAHADDSVWLLVLAGVFIACTPQDLAGIAAICPLLICSSVLKDGCD